jgi:hypothetical protein
MTPMRPTVARARVGAVAALMLLFSTRAGAQQPLPPLPPPSSDPGAPPPAAPPAAAPVDAPASGRGAPAPEAAPPPVAVAEPSPAPHGESRLDDEKPHEPTHAPKFSLWLGGSLRALGYGGNFYDNEQGKKETTGNFLGNGLGLELDVGARLGKRYMPFLFVEHGFMGAGHRFAGSDAKSSSDLYGVGFRYTAGDVDSAGFLTELAIGVRTVTVTGGGQTYKMSALEIFRLGLGAEIRISTLFVLSPMAHLSAGVMDSTSGTVAYSADGSKDGIKEPTFRNGDSVNAERGYVVLGIGCGAHFDVFGK